jgi:hypothetical protein
MFQAAPILKHRTNQSLAILAGPRQGDSTTWPSKVGESVKHLPQPGLGNRRCLFTRRIAVDSDPEASRRPHGAYPVPDAKEGRPNLVECAKGVLPFQGVRLYWEPRR